MNPLSAGVTGSGPVDSLARRLEDLEQQLARLRRRGRWAVRLVGLVLIAAVMFPGIGGRLVRALPPEEAPAPGRTPTAIARGQLDLAREAIAIIERATERGIPALNQPREVAYWSIRTLRARLFLSFGADEVRTEDPEVFLTLPRLRVKPDQIAAFEEHWVRMKRWEERLRRLFEQGGFSRLNLTYATERRLEAELWLARARLKTGN